MAKIVVYPVKPIISADDIVIGTDASNDNATKNFSMGGISDFVMTAVTTYVNNAIAAAVIIKRGLFYSNTTQVAVALTAKPLAMENTDIDTTDGISIAMNGFSVPCRITFPVGGVYRIGISAQMANDNTAKQDIMIWLSKNGESNFMIDTTKRFSLDTIIPFGTAYAEYVVKVDANDYISPIWMTSHADMYLEAQVANSNFPSRPSVYVTVNKI
jgi:hypothetical protein